MITAIHMLIYSDDPAATRAFLRDVNDIQKVIGNDLTPTGQASVKQTAVAQSVHSEGARVKSSIDDAEQAIDRFRSQITPTN